MKLIADSGSTKTDWRLIAPSTVYAFESEGINPYFKDEAAIRKTIATELLPSLQKQNLLASVTEIYFYGAGCSTIANKQQVKDAFQIEFPKAIITIEHDLLAAAHSLCGNEPGMVAILGTGSNSCFYNGREISENRRALGFVLGDEGSGAYMGKTLLQDFCNEEIPSDLSEKLINDYDLSVDKVLHHIYKESLPNKYAASFSKWIAENKSNDYCQNLILNSLNDFFTKHIIKYEKHRDYPLHLVGTIALVFGEELNEIAKKYQVTIGNTTNTPIEGLVAFHQS